MKLAVASDIHGQWADIDYPEADVLALAGDLLSNRFGPQAPELDAQIQFGELRAFTKFLKSQVLGKSCSEIVLIGGNHDFVFQYMEDDCKELLFKTAIFLQNDSVMIDGLKFYGSPWTPWFFDWAHVFPQKKAAGAAAAKACWDLIPADVDVLITHGPPHGIRDMVARGPVGCPELLARLPALTQLKLHVFGHIHPGAGLEQREIAGRNVKFANAAILDDDYVITNPVQVVEVP